MSDLFSALKENEIFKIANEIYLKKEFKGIDDPVEEKEKVVGEANDLEKTFFTAKYKLIHLIQMTHEKVLELKSQPDLSEQEKEEEFVKIALEQIKFKSGIDIFDRLFWKFIEYRLPNSCRNWDSMGIREKWQIVGFDVNNKETMRSVANRAEKCLLDQEDLIVTKLLNQFYFNEEFPFNPESPLNENEMVLGELNAFEKVAYNLVHFNRIKVHEYSEKIKTGEHVDFNEVELFNRLAETYDNIFWVSVHYRFGDKRGNFNNGIGVRKNWKVVAFRKEEE